MADSLLKDIKVNLGVLIKTITSTTLTISEIPFTPIGSTNEKTIKQIDSHEVKNVSFNLIADPDASSAVYKLPITIEINVVIQIITCRKTKCQRGLGAMCLDFIVSNILSVILLIIRFPLSL